MNGQTFRRRRLGEMAWGFKPLPTHPAYWPVPRGIGDEGGDVQFRRPGRGGWGTAIQGPPIHVQGLSSPQSCVLASVFMCVCVCVCVCKQGVACCEMMAKNNILH